MIKEVAAMAKIESHNTLEKILENGIIAISRGNYGDTLLRAVDAAARGGIKAVEITFEQNLAPEIAGEALDKLVRRFGTVLAVGAGTVLTLEQLSIAAQAGAKYIVSPNSDCYIIKETKRRGLISIPGAMTPTEITAAHAAGADIVKPPVHSEWNTSKRSKHLSGIFLLRLSAELHPKTFCSLKRRGRAHTASARGFLMQLQ